MNAKKCDRCGKLYVCNSKDKRKYILCEVDEYPFMPQLDLCDDCSEELTAWFNKKKSQEHFETKPPEEEG